VVFFVLGEGLGWLVVRWTALRMRVAANRGGGLVVFFVLGEGLGWLVVWEPRSACASRLTVGVGGVLVLGEGLRWFVVRGIALRMRVAANL